MQMRIQLCSLFFSACILVFCTKLTAAESATLASQANRPLQVAVIIPLSGPVAQFGQAVRRGIELAQNQQDVDRQENNRAEQAVDFNFYDNAFSVVQSVSTLQSLLSTKAHKPDVVISIDATHGNALRPIC